MLARRTCLWVLLMSIVTSPVWATNARKPPCWHEILKMLDPQLPPIAEVVLALKAELAGEGITSIVPNNENILVIDAPDFSTAVLVDRRYAYTGYRGYGVVTEIDRTNGQAADQTMLMNLHPEGVAAWLANPALITQDEFHRDTPPSFKITAELRAFLASDEYRQQRWNSERIIYFQVRDAAIYRRYIYSDPSQEALDEAGVNLTPEGQGVLDASTRVWERLEADYVQSGRARLVRPFRRTGSGPETKVGLTFPTRGDFQQFLLEPGVDFAFIHIPDPLDPSHEP
jgi:hypothetical protein